MELQCYGKKNDEKKSYSHQTRRKLMVWSLSFAFLFAFTLAGFYYCIELVRSVKHSHLLLEKRVIEVEREQRDAYNLMLKITNTIQNVTVQFGETRNELPLRGVSKFEYEGDNNKKKMKKRLRRNVRPGVDNLTVPGSRDVETSSLENQAKVLERTIHGFRREMFTLNDR